MRDDSRMYEVCPNSKCSYWGEAQHPDYSRCPWCGATLLKECPKCLELDRHSYFTRKNPRICQVCGFHLKQPTKSDGSGLRLVDE